jgi:hypothetical protein
MSDERQDVDTEQEAGELPADISEGVRAGLARLRDLTRMTGAIYDAQMLQLKYWPLILFPASQHSIEYNNEERTLTIVMRLNAALPEGDDLKLRIKTFQKWCWALLGDDWSVRLRYREGKGGKSKELYKGRRRQAVKKEAQPPIEYGLKATTEFKRYQNLDKRKASQAVADELPPLVPAKSPRA